MKKDAKGKLKDQSKIKFRPILISYAKNEDEHKESLEHIWKQDGYVNVRLKIYPNLKMFT